MNILEIKDLNINYISKGRLIRAVNNIDLDIEKNKSLGIVGESGSGKSTLAMGILRLLPESNSSISGEINYRRTNLLEREDFGDLRWKEISVVFQKSMNALSPVHRISSQIVDIYRVHYPRASKKEIEKRALELFKIVNLPERAYRAYPHELSGGMMQRVSIAISLLFNPEILILDEATTALDVITERQILEEIKDLEKDFNLTRIMITHDVSVVASSCDRVAVMYAGFILEEGRVEDVFVEPMHPYTVGLLASYPSLRGEEKSLRGIEGSLPDISKKHEGCIFYDRCSKRMEICRKEPPLRKRQEDGRTVACHLLGGV